MTIDLTEAFEEAAKHAGTWANADVVNVIEAIRGNRPDARVDWEPGDENWARILDAEAGRVIAYICARFPLGFVGDTFAPISGPNCFVWVPMKSADEPAYGIRPELLDNLFARPVSRALNYNQISADEIWWATVS